MNIPRSATNYQYTFLKALLISHYNDLSLAARSSQESCFFLGS